MKKLEYASLYRSSSRTVQTIKKSNNDGVKIYKSLLIIIMDIKMLFHFIKNNYII